MYYKMNEDFLAHYGVLGMKWGQRKAKTSSSGSKTLSKRKIKKSTEYRSHRINKLKTGIESEQRDAKRYKKEYDELKKQGVKSKRIIDYANSFDDKEYLDMIGGKKGLLKEELSYIKMNHEKAIDRGKAFTESLLAIQNTDPNKQTVREIRRIETSAWNKSLNESVNKRK